MIYSEFLAEKLLSLFFSLSLYFSLTHTHNLQQIQWSAEQWSCAFLKGDMIPTSEPDVIVFYFTAHILFRVKVRNDLYLFTQVL